MVGIKLLLLMRPEECQAHMKHLEWVTLCSIHDEAQIFMRHTLHAEPCGRRWGYTEKPGHLALKGLLVWRRQNTQTLATEELSIKPASRASAGSQNVFREQPHQRRSPREPVRNANSPALQTYGIRSFGGGVGKLVPAGPPGDCNAR